MYRQSAKDAAADRVYRTIKANVIAYVFPQGQRILMQPVADALGVSTTPVREALNRLAAEDLVIKAPHKGFIAPTLSEDKLRGYYDLTRLLLATELEGLDAAARKKLSGFEPIAEILRKLNRRVINDANVLAAYTGEIFSVIASLGWNAQVVRSIEHASDHLFYIRTVECRYLDSIQVQLVLLCEMILSGRCDRLLTAVHEYHDVRNDALSMLIRLANQ